MKTIWIPVALIALTAGCGSSSGGGNSLTNAQVMMLVQAMGSARNSGSGALMDNAQLHATNIDHGQPPAHHHPNTTTTISPTTANCADGGTASVSGSLDTTGTLTSGSTLTISSLDFDITMTNCENVGSDGNTYTVNSDGPLTVTGSGSYSLSGTTLSGSMTSTESGTVVVTGTSLNVTCAFNLAVTETQTSTTVSASVVGTVCGNTVNISASY